MKMSKNLPRTRSHAIAIATGVALALIVAGCSDENSVRLKSNAPNLAAAGRSNIIGNTNSTSAAGDYSINLTVVGTLWTYVITKNAGAKDLSHFILNFQNCGSNSATINNIVWATVNGAPAVLSNSEGNTGCTVNDVTTNFVKFDNLPDASSYTIMFEVNRVFGNFVGTTAWLKAGNSCNSYSVLAPCCPL